MKIFSRIRDAWAVLRGRTPTLSLPLSVEVQSTQIDAQIDVLQAIQEVDMRVRKIEQQLSTESAALRREIKDAAFALRMSRQ